jgi:hypothetical protein
MHHAAKVGSEPNLKIRDSRCVRSQHKNCGGSEKFDAALQRAMRPFIQVAAKLRGRIYTSPD